MQFMFSPKSMVTFMFSLEILGGAMNVMDLQLCLFLFIFIFIFVDRRLKALQIHQSSTLELVSVSRFALVLLISQHFKIVQKN